MRSFLLFLFTVLACSLYASTDTVFVQDLRYSWVESNQGVPTPVNSPSSVRLISFAVPEDGGDLVRVCCDEPVDIWVNLRLISSGKAKCQVFSIDSLSSHFRSDSLVFQISSSFGLSELSTTLLLVEEDSEEDLTILSRNKDFRNFFVIGLTLLVMVLSVARITFPQRFSRIYLNPFKAGGSTIEDYYDGFWDQGNMAFLLWLSLSLSFLLTCSFPGVNDQIFGEIIQTWLIIWVWVLVFMAFRIIVVSVVSRTFKLSAMAGIQNHDFFNYLFWLMLVVFMGVFLGVTSFSWLGLFSGQTLIKLIIFFLLLYQFLSYLKFGSLIPRQKILIISYLCGTEMMPAFALIYAINRWFV